jgi:hypothetical protein
MPQSLDPQCLVRGRTTALQPEFLFVGVNPQILYICEDEVKRPKAHQNATRIAARLGDPHVIF